MAWMTVYGPCCLCGGLFHFNADQVPSIRGAYREGKFKPDPAGTKEPVCESCMALINAERAKHGLEPFPILPDAYEAQQVA